MIAGLLMAALDGSLLVEPVNEIMTLFLDSEFTTKFFFPGMCAAVNQKLYFAAKKTNSRIRCII